MWYACYEFSKSMHISSKYKIATIAKLEKELFAEFVFDIGLICCNNNVATVGELLLLKSLLTIVTVFALFRCSLIFCILQFCFPQFSCP
jgi:hypothetical protein